MKKIFLAVFAFVFLFNINFALANDDLDISIDLNGTENHVNPIIRWNDVGADHYALSAFCESGISMTGTTKFDCLSGKGEPEIVYPTGKDTIRFEALSFTNNTNSPKKVTIDISFINSGGGIIDSERLDIEIPSVDAVKTDLNLSVSPVSIQNHTNPIIRWNDVGADYYVLSAACKDGLHTTGKARPDLCVEGDKIYPTGKDVLRVDDFYFYFNNPNNEKVKTGLNVIVSAVKNEKLMQEDTVWLEIKDNDNNKKEYDSNDDSKTEIKGGNASDTAILRLVVDILKNDGASKNSQLIQILELILSILQK